MLVSNGGRKPWLSLFMYGCGTFFAVPSVVGAASVAVSSATAACGALGRAVLYVVFVVGEFVMSEVVVMIEVAVII